jgi:hypothetical protein
MQGKTMMATTGDERATAESDAAIEPRLFLVRLEGKKPAYAVCERTAIIAEPSEDKEGFAGMMYRQVDELFRERAKVARPSAAIGIPAEIDPRGGGYMIMGSSMGNGEDR